MNTNESHGEGNQLKTEVLRWKLSHLKWEKEKGTSVCLPLNSVAFIYSAFTYALVVFESFLFGFSFLLCIFVPHT